MGVRVSVKTLETRVYASYLARLRASKRLAMRLAVWNLTLTVVSTVLLIVSVAQLAFGISTTWEAVATVAVSTILLAVTLVNISLNYGARVERLIVNYRALQSLSVELEAASERKWLNWREYNAWAARYDILLDASENHTWADHLGANPKSAREIFAVARSGFGTFWPLAGVAVALGVAVVVLWPR